MPTFLMTVQAEDFKDGVLLPSIRLSRFRGEPVLKSIVPGRRLQLRRPDGTRQSVLLNSFAVEGVTRVAYSSADDATLYSFSNDPAIQLLFKTAITEEFAPLGTEIWVID